MKFSKPPCSLGILDGRLGAMFVKYLPRISAISCFSVTVVTDCIVYNSFFWDIFPFVFRVASDFIYNFPDIFNIVFISCKKFSVIGSF